MSEEARQKEIAEALNRPPVTPEQLADIERAIPVIRKYVPCGCGGWSERFDVMSGINNPYHPTSPLRSDGITLNGRENHMHGCTTSPSALAQSDIDAAEKRGREAGWDEGYAKGNLDGYFGTHDEKNPYTTHTERKA